MDFVQDATQALYNLSLPVQLGLGICLIGVCCLFVGTSKPYANIPLANDGPKGKETWTANGKGILAEAAKKYPGCFQVVTGSGYKIVVPNRFLDELKDHPELSLSQSVAKDLMVHYPGFEGLRAALLDETFIQEVIRVKLTQNLGLLTHELVEEANDAFHDILGAPKEWMTRALKTDLLDIVARLSARMFLGPELARSEEWLRISKEYSVDAHKAAHELTKMPSLLRPLLYWFSARCARMRKQVRTARRLIRPAVDKRRKELEEAKQKGETVPKGADAVRWMLEVANGRPRDLVAAQLSLITAGVHITSEEMAKCILQLCDRPEFIKPLREEIVSVLKEFGWTKTALYKLRLMDSFLKEVQRIDGFFVATISRYAKASVVLSDGTVLPKGSRILVPNDKVQDPELFPDPENFDLERFTNLRSMAGEENRHQYVTTSSAHLGFGHGQHACPGRFLVASEIKTAMCFFLLKYDIRYEPDTVRPPTLSFETQRLLEPKVKIQIRRRMEEVDLLRPLA